jgi:hypothetical protein
MPTMANKSGNKTDDGRPQAMSLLHANSVLHFYLCSRFEGDKGLLWAGWLVRVKYLRPPSINNDASATRGT